MRSILSNLQLIDYSVVYVIPNKPKSELEIVNRIYLIIL